MRNLNLLVVMDPKTREVKWHQTGPWLRQHDPDFAFDGRIEIFDNRMGLEIEGSQVVSVDPATGKTEVIYGGRDGERFYSEILGKIQAMPSGHVLITIPNEGRLLEVDLTGRPVWQFINRVDDEFRGILWSADVLPEGYLQDGALDCVK
jgi:hypothetical protein